MLTEEHIKNIKQHKEPKTVVLSVISANAIAAGLTKLTKNSFENSLKELLEEQLDKHRKEIRRIRIKQHCEHKWHEFTKEEIYMFGSPRMYGIEDRDKEFIEACDMNEFCYCDKCRMPYKYREFDNCDFERIIDKYVLADTITLTAHTDDSEFLFEWLADKKLMEEKELLEEKIKSLRERTKEDSSYMEQIQQLEKEIDSLKTKEKQCLLDHKTKKS